MQCVGPLWCKSCDGDRVAEPGGLVGSGSEVREIRPHRSKIPLNFFIYWPKLLNINKSNGTQGSEPDRIHPDPLSWLWDLFVCLSTKTSAYRKSGNIAKHIGSIILGESEVLIYFLLNLSLKLSLNTTRKVGLYVQSLPIQACILKLKVEVDCGNNIIRSLMSTYISFNQLQTTC